MATEARAIADWATRNGLSEDPRRDGLGLGVTVGSVSSGPTTRNCPPGAGATPTPNRSAIMSPRQKPPLEDGDVMLFRSNL